jgi:hypothetical protein
MNDHGMADVDDSRFGGSFDIVGIAWNRTPRHL